jgi:hypothetical protein
VEEIPQKLIIKSLKNKIPKEQYLDMYNIKIAEENKKEQKGKPEPPAKVKKVEKEKKPKEEVKEEEEIVITTKQKNYGSILEEISGSLKAVLFDGEGNELKKIPVRELTDEIKKSNNISTVVFDGIITQRLLDIASNKNVKEIVGIKTGNVVKLPKTVKILTKTDFQ